MAHQHLFKLYGSIEKIEEQDDGTIMVFGIASSEARDGAGEIIRADAMRDALPDYSKFPALREMHQPMAAGKVTEAEVDAEGVTHIAAHVVDPVAIVKIRTGVYAGFSIGGKVLKRDPADKSVITALRLIEISLVDSPCNPDAILSMWKADNMSDFKPSSEDTIARAKLLAKAAGSARFKDFLFEASQELISEHLIEKGELEPPADVVETVAEIEEPAAVVVEEPAAEAPAEAPAAVEEPNAEAAAEEAPAAEAEAPAGDEGGQEAAGEGEEGKEAAEQPDPAAALADALGKADEAITAAKPADEEEAPSPFADLGAVAKALKSIALPDGCEKSLYAVGRLAELISSLACVQECAAWEKESEGDDSPVPEQLRAAVANLGEILIAMAQEEVAELIAALKSEPEVIEIIYAGEGIELAEQIVDLVKANADLIGQAEDRLAKRAPPEAVTYEAENAELRGQIDELGAEKERIEKALEAATPAVEDLTRRFGETIDGLNVQIADLRKRFEEEPLPPKTAGSARAISKGDDSAGGSGGGAAPASDVLSKEQIAEAWSNLSDQEKGELLLRVALANPQAIKLPLSA
jgi:phage head maturation protease